MSFIPEELPRITPTRNFEPPPAVKSEVLNTFMREVLEVVTNHSFVKRFQNLSAKSIEEIKRTDHPAHKRKVARNPSKELDLKEIFEKNCLSRSKNAIRKEIAKECEKLINKKLDFIPDKYWFIASNKELKEKVISIVCDELMECFFEDSEVNKTAIHEKVNRGVSDFFHHNK